MSLKGLFVKEKEKPQPAAEPDSEVESVEETPALATGPLGARRTPSSRSGPSLRRPFASGLAKVNEEKLTNLRKRVFGSTPTPYTQVLDQVEALKNVGISDTTSQYKGAIAVSRVTKAQLQDAVTTHKEALFAQREGFAKHIAGLRDQTQARRQEIEKQVAEMQAKFQELEAEDASLQQKQQELESGEQEFVQLADALSQEIDSTGTQLLSLCME